MYTSFFGFTEKPFNITPDPRFLFLTEAHVEALASLYYGIREKKGFVCITGEVGTGKTTIIYRLIDSLRDKVRSAFIFNTSTTFDQLLKNILLELRIPIDDENQYLLIDRLNNYLLERMIVGEVVTIFIDEAQNLPAQTLEELRMLSNMETRREKLLQIVLVGQPELEAKINSEELRQLRQRIVVRRRIRPLSQQESREYIAHRLRLVGGSSRIFTPEAISLVCQYSQGIPRTINVLCDNALFASFGAGRKKVADDMIREVLVDMNGCPPPIASAAMDTVSVKEPANIEGRRLGVLRRLLLLVTKGRAECQ